MIRIRIIGPWKIPVTWNWHMCIAVIARHKIITEQSTSIIRTSFYFKIQTKTWTITGNEMLLYKKELNYAQTSPQARP